MFTDSNIHRQTSREITIFGSASNTILLYLTLPKCRVLVNVGDHETPPISILRHPHHPGGMSSTRLAASLILCLPLALLPFIFPRNTFFYRQSCLSKCPRNFNCLLLTAPINSLLTSAICITLSFVTLADHGILIILLRIQISTASILLFNFLSCVKLSRPHNGTTKLTKQNISLISFVISCQYSCSIIFFLCCWRWISPFQFFSTPLSHIFHFSWPWPKLFIFFYSRDVSSFHSDVHTKFFCSLCDAHHFSFWLHFNCVIVRL